jgi:hypothetical protein
MVDVKLIRAINLNTICVFVSAIPFFFYQRILQNYEWGQYAFVTAFAIGAGS